MLPEPTARRPRVNTHILAIDPGPVQSAVVTYSLSETDITALILDNDAVLALLALDDKPEQSQVLLAVEMIASYGMAVGKDVFETCVWIGRFIQAWTPREYRLVYRKDVKLHLCQSMRAKDSNIRQVLIDRFGKPGTKKNPGATYGIAKDMWSALAVAVTAVET